MPFGFLGSRMLVWLVVSQYRYGTTAIRRAD